MLLLELIEYLTEHKGELTLSGVFLFFLRKIIIHEIKQLLQFGRDRELTWTRERVERLTGENYVGAPSVLPKRAHQNLRRLYCLLLKAIRQGFQRRRRKMNNVNWITLIPALLGVLKLILQPFGVDLSHITDDQVNTLINGVAAAIAIWGVVRSHQKPDALAQPQTKDYGPNSYQ